MTENEKLEKLKQLQKEKGIEEGVDTFKKYPISFDDFAKAFPKAIFDNDGLREIVLTEPILVLFLSMVEMKAWEVLMEIIDEES